MLEEKVVVRGDGAKFRIALFDPLERAVHIGNRYGKNLFDECRAKLPINHGEQVSSPLFPRHNEVRLRIADPLSSVDDFRPCINEFPTIELFRFGSTSLSFLVLQFVSRRLDFSSVNAFQETFDGVSRNISEGLFSSPHSPRDTFWRAPREQAAFDKGAEILVADDLHALILRVLSPDICFEIRFLRIVFLSDFVSSDLIRDRGNASTECVCDFAQ